jgi:hypothetical protein
VRVDRELPAALAWRQRYPDIVSLFQDM